jgi:Ser/Thr protein kinase RdoA (MazF antagonist)
MSAEIEDLTRRATFALSHWGLPAQVPELIKYRENAVFKVQLESGEPAALRLHRPGYHSEAALRSELAFMRVLGDRGLDVPKPIATKTGAFLAPVAGEETQFVDLIGWVAGRQVGESGKPLDHSDAEVADIYRKIGVAMARLHDVADRWQAPSDFTRPSWDRVGLVGDRPLWGRFWDCPGLSNRIKSFSATCVADSKSASKRFRPISTMASFTLISCAKTWLSIAAASPSSTSTIAARAGDCSISQRRFCAIGASRATPRSRRH